MSSTTTATGQGGSVPDPTPLEVPLAELDQLVRGEHGQPHSILGPHRHDDGSGVTVRVLRPLATSVVIHHGGTRSALRHEHEGVWVGVLALADVPDYRVAVSYGEDTHVVDDPFRFLPTLGEMDLHLINEGRHEQLWTVLGARVHHYDVPGSEPITGTSFAVWAPNARAVRLRGDFNSWDGREHPMRALGSSGVWELFVPGLGTGTAYKFHVLGQDGTWREKADPMAFHAEVAPRTSSRVFESTHAWADQEWMTERSSNRPVAEPMSIYEMHLGSWKRHPDSSFWSYDEIADDLVPYLADLGFTHVELMPVMQHPFGGS